MLPALMMATPKPRPPKEALSVQDAAAILGVHEDTIRRWIADGFLAATRCGRRLIRIPRSEIARLRHERLA